MQRFIITILFITIFLAGTQVQVLPFSCFAHSGRVYAADSIQAPELKWEYAGCYSSWCERGWYSSPAVFDLDGDGHPEVIGSAYSVVVLNGETGELLWRVKSGHDRNDADADNVGRTWPGIVIADVDNDAELEIVTAHGGGWVSVYNTQGYFDNNGWPWQNPTGHEFRSLSVADLDGDGDMEIVVGRAELKKHNVWVLDHTGKVCTGWPQLNTNEGSAAGLYNDNIGLGDIDGDSLPDVIVPSDTITICAYNADGAQHNTNEIYYGHSGHDMDYWGEVPAYVDLEYETRGWGPCYDGYTLRANFANGPANVVDVNGDGINEIVVVGDVHDCHTSPYTDHYNGPYIFNPDRSRFNMNGFNWETLPVDTGEPIIQNYNVIESVQPNTVTVDLDGDGFTEILFPSYDGRMHAFWLDKTEHYNWPYSVYHSSEGTYRFASEPVVADLDNDGFAEVIFTSWVEKGSNKTGKLHILDYKGNPLHEIDLPVAYDSSDWNGSLPAPTLADIDGDPELELVLNTAHSGFVAYDLPDTDNARILWGTGRGSYLRSGIPGIQGPVIPGPDLKIKWIKLIIKGPNKKGLYNINGKVKITNIGNQVSGKCKFGIYYPEGGSLIFKKPKNVKKLKPSKSIIKKFQVKGLNIPTDTSGIFIAEVDPDNRINEINEDNNIAEKQVNGVDLRGEWLKVKNKKLKKNRYRIKGKYVIESDLPAGKFHVQAYLSENSILDGNDTPLFKKPRKIKKIKGGKQIRDSFKSKVKYNPSGDYLILKLDTENSIAETDEGNNEISHKIP